MTPLPRSTPEAEGISSAAIVDFIAAAEEQLESLHSLMVVRHGRVVAEGWWSPYAAQHPHSLFSVSKSFTSTAVGLAIGEGRLTLDSLIVDLLPDELPAQIDPHLAALTVRHLLTMTTGHATDTVSLADDAPGDNWARAILAQPLEFAPGTRFVYNTGASYLLSAVLQRLTGERLFDYLTPRLFAPLGIVGATWETCPRGIDAGGWGLSLTTEQLATFGQLLLRRGRWNGTQLVPAAWIDEATAVQVDTSGSEHDLDGRQGYGYQYWRNRPTGYRADGAFGQFCLVLPETDAVIVLTAALPTAQRALDLVWEHLLPAFTDQPLPELAEMTELTELESGLAGTLASLTLPTVDGEPSSPTAARVAGIRFGFDDAEVTEVTFEPGLLTIIRGGVSTALAFGHGQWVASGDVMVLASGAWVSPATLVVRAHDVGTPFSRTFTLEFGDDALTLDIEQNVAFGDLPRTHLVSR
ncbi:serine hydrolase domain-containing protein [Cryobacterium cryoconiti]|uniref:Class C beta-lactamase-related serine hydrolase n=1 Tax=Cryobacterium cryoconiti TaxID=1259239 RepID=A0A4Y8JZY9_9MICO|nr:serine hydrolase [Cryobacterium cryoconiti]TFD34159.1 class C beta-lactamase-related serine hydrolase [Cryobacterium cryoconiti]